MKQNMGTIDRLVRVFIAAAFAALYFTGVVTNITVATVLWGIGVVLVITAAVGFCPLYTIKKWNTHKKK